MLAPDALKALAKLNGWDARTTRECPGHGVWRYDAPTWIPYDPADWYSSSACPACRNVIMHVRWWYEAS